MLLFFLGVLLLVAGAIVAVVRRGASRVDVEYQIATVGGCALITIAAARALFLGTAATVTISSRLPGGAWIFALDPLSALFLLGIGIIGAITVPFGAAYLAPERSHRPVWLVHALVAVLLASMALVVTAQAVVPFLSVWEVMAVSGYLLVMTEHEHRSVRRAGLVYLVATHAGTLALVAMFAAWAPEASDWSFAALSSSARALPSMAPLVLVLAVVGFGFKAGFVPLHFWLPPAHASAPSHVSALLSGVMIKTGIYGILRMVSLQGGASPAWGWLMLAIGAASAVLGVLWALAQHDLKRLLAYHSVENIGIIGMGIGVGALGAAYGHPMVAVFGYAGALLHTLNHALFKSLLFLGAGVVQRLAGTRDLEALGGLAKRMPYPALAFIVGSAAIIGVPPLNGFVSEWLVYLGLLRAAQSKEVLRLAALGVPLLALVGALALACFAKVVGVAFLGSPRSEGAANAGDARSALTVPMLVLAGLCVLLGVMPVLGAAPAMRVAAIVAGVSPSASGQMTVAIADATRISLLAGALVALIALLYVVRQRVLSRATVRAAETWACGYTLPSARMQYTASSFAAPLIASFGRASGVVIERSPTSFATHPEDLVLDRTAIPIWRRILRLAFRLRPIQQGRLYMYLLYVMAALVALLGYLALER